MPVECALLEQRRAAAEDHRVHRNTKLVDQAVRDQVRRKVGAAEQKGVLVAFPLQSRHRTGRIRPSAIIANSNPWVYNF